MSSKHVSQYRLHKASGRAVVTLPAPGPGQRRRDVFLGAYGSPRPFDAHPPRLCGSPASRPRRVVDQSSDSGFQRLKAQFEVVILGSQRLDAVIAL